MSVNLVPACMHIISSRPHEYIAILTDDLADTRHGQVTALCAHGARFAFLPWNPLHVKCLLEDQCSDISVICRSAASAMSSPVACPTMAGSPSTSLIAFLSVSSGSYKIPCSLNHAMASTYDIRLNGRWGAVNLDLPKLTIAAVVWLARMATDSQICRSLDQQRNMRKIIVIRRLTSMWLFRSSIVTNANSASSCRMLAQMATCMAVRCRNILLRVEHREPGDTFRDTGENFA